MVECGNGISLTALCLLISVFQIMTREAAEGKSIPLDVSRIRINPLECYDRTKSCAKQADNGYCESNYHYMIDRCPWSCRFCRRAGGDTKKCRDISKNCSAWVSNTECTTRPDFMSQNCKKSCEMCGPESDYNATDTESTCPYWAKAGWCETNIELLDKCPHSCLKYSTRGESSVDERYITVNFRNTSSLSAPSDLTIAAPPPPSGAISAHSDLDVLPPDLRTVLANEWLNSRLLKLTQKQNEYITHPQIRNVSLPLPPRDSNQTAWRGNNTIGMTMPEQRLRNATASATPIDKSEQGEMLAFSASAPPARAYDSLLPKLFLGGGPIWANRNKNLQEHRKSNSTSQENQEVWKEEKEEDEDLDESGQQKGEVPSVDIGKEEGHSGDLDLDMASSGSGEVNDEKVAEEESKDSGEEAANDYDKIEQNTTIAVPSSGGGEVNDEKVAEDESKASGEEVANDDEKIGQDITIAVPSSESGEVNGEKVAEEESKASGEEVANDDDKIGQDTTIAVPSSGSNDVNEYMNTERKQVASGGSGANEKERMEQNTSEEEKARGQPIAFYNPPSAQARENVRIVLPENSFSGSGQLDNYERNADIDFSSSGSGQYEEDERLGLTTSPRSME